MLYYFKSADDPPNYRGVINIKWVLTWMWTLEVNIDIKCVGVCLPAGLALRGVCFAG